MARPVAQAFRHERDGRQQLVRRHTGDLIVGRQPVAQGPTGRQHLVEQGVGAPHVVGRCLGDRHVEEHLHQVDEGDLLAAQPASDGAHGAELGQQPVAALRRGDVVRGQPGRCLVERHRLDVQLDRRRRLLRRDHLAQQRVAQPEVDVLGQVPADPQREGLVAATHLVHARHPTGGPLTRLDPHRYRPGTASTCGRNTQAKGAKPMTTVVDARPRLPEDRTRP